MQEITRRALEAECKSLEESVLHLDDRIRQAEEELDHLKKRRSQKLAALEQISTDLHEARQEARE